jgi:hypothetical protein
MKTMKSKLQDSLTILTFTLTTLSAVTACTSSDKGYAIPGPTVLSDTPASETPAADPFNGLESCTVLDKALQGQGFPPAAVNTVGGDNGCGTDKVQYGGVTLVLQPNLGIRDLNADKTKQRAGDVHGRPSIVTRNAIGAGRQCDIAWK